MTWKLMRRRQRNAEKLREKEVGEFLIKFNWNLFLVGSVDFGGASSGAEFS
jgi:hypothetical protein